MPIDETALLALLDRALSADERRCLFAGALAALDAGGRERLLAGLDGDTAETIRDVLEEATEGGPEHRHGKPTLPSKDRVLEEWRRAWREWDDAVLESSDEEGPFVAQDHHWESPYFDLDALAERLEGIADRMLPLVPRVAADGLALGFDFLAKLLEDVEEIGAGLPEWLGEPDWSWLFGPNVTSCLLRWEWLSSRRATGAEPTEGAFALLDRIRRAEAAAERWSLHSSALVDVVLGLPHTAQREILAGTEANAEGPHWV